MRSGGRNTWSGVGRGHTRTGTEGNQIYRELPDHLNPNDDERFDHVSSLPRRTQPPHRLLGNPFSHRTSISVDRTSDCTHPSGAAACSPLNDNTANSPSQSFHNFDRCRDHGLPIPVQINSTNLHWTNMCQEAPAYSHHHFQAGPDVRTPQSCSTSHAQSGVGFHTTTPAPLSSPPAASCFVWGSNNGGYPCVNLVGDVAMAAGYGTVSGLNERECIMVQPQFLQMLIQQHNQPQSTMALNGFTPSSAPRMDAPRVPSNTSALGSAAIVSNMDASLMQLLSDGVGSTAQLPLPTPPQQKQQLGSIQPPLSFPFTDPVLEASHLNKTISVNNRRTAHCHSTCSANSIYGEPQKQGRRAPASAESSRGTNPESGLSASPDTTKLYHHHRVWSTPRTPSMKGSDRLTHMDTFSPATFLATMSPLPYLCGLALPTGEVTAPVLWSEVGEVYPAFTGSALYGSPTISLPPHPLPPSTAAQFQSPMKPSKRSANLHRSQHIAKAPITENPYITAADAKGRDDVHLEDGSDGCHKNSGAGVAVDAVVGEAHAGQTNGKNFVVGDWYEGIVKRYNPLRGFGFLTCTHRLHFDLHACERACTRDADAMYAKQQECEVVNSVTAVISSMRATSKSANEDGVEQGTQKLQELESSSNNSKAQHTDDTSTTPLMTSKQPVKETDTHCPPAAVSTTHAGNAHDSDAGDAAAPPPPPPEVPLTSKAQRTVVYSTMQRYLSLIDTAGKETLPRDAGDASRPGHASEGGEYTSRAPVKELGKLEREPAQLGDIFVHHSCISMSGFRVFAHGTAVRFSVAVLKKTVQAVDVVQLGLESVESLSVNALAQPPLYKVTPAAATVLRYHRLEAERDNREYRVGDGKPQSCVGSTSVQWTDMAVIPSPAIPNSLEGQIELRVVHVPPPSGTMSHETTAMVTGERRNHGDGKDYGVKAQTANATDPASATTSTSAAAEAQGVPECLKTPTDISSVRDPDHEALLVVVVASQQQKHCHYPEEEHRRDGAKDPTTKLNSGGREHGTCVKSVLQQKTSEDSNSFCGGDLTSSRSDQTSGAGDSRFTGAQTSSCGSRNKTTTTTTDPMQYMYEDTDRLNLVLQHCLEHRKEIPRDVKCTTSHGSSGSRAETVLTHCMHEKTSSLSQSAGAGHGAEKNQLKDSEAAPLAAGSTATAPARTSAATAGDGTAPAPANVEFSASQTNDDTDSPAKHMCQGGSGSGDGSDEEKAPTTTTTAPTTPFGNTMPGCNHGPAPDWTDLFDLKMATEREKDIVMHKTDFKLLPHQSSRASAVTAAPNHQKSGAVVNVCALVLNMVSFTSGAELDSTSSPGIAENEDVQDGDSRPARGSPPWSRRVEQI